MPDPKRLLFVCNTSWGICKFRLPVIRALIGMGHALYVLAPEDRYSNELRSEPGLSFIPLYHLKATSLSPLSDFRLYRELQRHYHDIDPECIFHYTIKANIYGALAASGTRAFTISVITGLGYTFLSNGWLRRIAGALYRFALAKADEVWFLNNDDRDHFIKRRIVAADKTSILPGEGIDIRKFTVTPPPEISSSTRFLLIGRVMKEKGIAEYAAASTILKQKGYDICCRLAGRLDQQMPSAIPQKKLTLWMDKGVIEYAGNSDDIQLLIQQADCIVLPSYREGLPMSLLEGASMGRPLIASNTAGCREIVDHGKNGYLCAPGDARSLANSMEMFCQLSAADRQKMGEASREIVSSRFTTEIVLARYLAKINGLPDKPTPQISLMYKAER